MLEKYGVLTLNKDTGTKDIKRLLNQYNCIENKDYKPGNVAGFNSGGRGNKIEYYLHPKTFKICLMRAKNTKIYAYYYLLLEECIKYFNDYKIFLKEKYIIKLKTRLINKDNKINHLEEKLNTIIKNNEELLKSNKIMQDSLNKAHYKLDETLEKLDDVHEELENTNNELEETTEKLDITDKTLNIVARKLNIAVEDRKNIALAIFFIQNNKIYDFIILQSY